MAKKKLAFGGYAINFKGCDDTLESVMGSKPIGPSVLMQKTCDYVKRKRVHRRPAFALRAPERRPAPQGVPRLNGRREGSRLERERLADGVQAVPLVVRRDLKLLGRRVRPVAPAGGEPEGGRARHVPGVRGDEHDLPRCHPQRARSQLVDTR